MMTRAAQPEPQEQVYATRGDVRLRAMVHPAADADGAARPAIVLFHGGGWRTSNVPQFAPQCEALAARRMVAIRCEYRVADVHGTTPADAIDDARAAMRWARANAASLGVDPSRVAAGGGSAGGHLAACCALLADDARQRPDALVLFNPMLDTSPATGFAPERFGAQALASSPLHALRPGALPPTLILHGSADAAVPIATARAFAARARAVGARCTMIEYAGAGHGFFNPAPVGDDASFVATRAAMLAFLESIGFCAWAPIRDRALQPDAR